ncbi:MAG: hypothetical protein AAF572_02075 [Cyanobacteria bacterium P01_B01_bin.77]
MTILNKLVSHNLIAGLILVIVIQPGLASTPRAEELGLKDSFEDITAADSLLAQTPAEAAPESEAEPESDNIETEDTDDTLRIVVTVTRTKENVLDVPRSVTVIEREQI